MKELRAGGLIISSDSFFFTRAEQLAAIALRREVPTIFGFREFATAGGLMSYGANILDAHREAWHLYRSHPQGREASRPAGPAGRRKFDLVINLTTAQALRIDVPPALLARADEVIE